VIAKYYFDTKKFIKRELDMNVDDNSKHQDNTDTTYSNYIYSIISMEVVKYHKDYFYLLWGADNGWFYSFWFKPEVLDQKVDDGAEQTVEVDKNLDDVLFNMRSTSLGNSPVYLSMMDSVSNVESDMVSIYFKYDLYLNRIRKCLHWAILRG